jgi:cytochrome oxidase Cu insertion factor (SCO1/SenC/PrrC family)
MSNQLRAVARVMLLLATTAVLCTLGLPAAQASWEDWASQRNADSRTPVSQEILDKYGFELDYADGSGKVSFKDLAESGHAFILVWWLSDCPVCHMQLPYVQQLQKQITDNKLDVRIVSICIDDDTKACLKYVNDKGITFDVLSDPHARRTDSKYRVKDFGTPVTYIFKPGGVYMQYLTGFKQQYSRAVLSQLGITLPADSDAPRNAQ